VLDDIGGPPQATDFVRLRPTYWPSHLTLNLKRCNGSRPQIFVPLSACLRRGVTDLQGSMRSSSAHLARIREYLKRASSWPRRGRFASRQPQYPPSSDVQRVVVAHLRRSSCCWCRSDCRFARFSRTAQERDKHCSNRPPWRASHLGEPDRLTMGVGAMKFRCSARWSQAWRPGAALGGAKQRGVCWPSC